MDVVALTAQKGFEMIGIGDTGEKVRDLQKQLIERWLLSGSVDSTYGERLRDAVLRAQKYYGLMETGSADERLIVCLDGAPNLPKTTVQSVQLHELGSTSIGLNRYWFANTVAPSAQPAQGRFAHAAGNRDNVLALFEGTIQNDGNSVLDLDWQLKGTLYLDGFAYGCVLLCERDRGGAFDAQLLPLAQSRLVVAAEIPRAALKTQSVTLVIEQGGKQLSFAGAA